MALLDFKEVMVAVWAYLSGLTATCTYMEANILSLNTIHGLHTASITGFCYDAMAF